MIVLHVMVENQFTNLAFTEVLLWISVPWRPTALQPCESLRHSFRIPSQLRNFREKSLPLPCHPAAIRLPSCLCSSLRRFRQQVLRLHQVRATSAAAHGGPRRRCEGRGRLGPRRHGAEAFTAAGGSSSARPMKQLMTDWLMVGFKALTNSSWLWSWSS